MLAGLIVFFTIVFALAAGILTGYGVLSLFLFVMGRSNRATQPPTPAISAAQTAS